MTVIRKLDKEAYAKHLASKVYDDQITAATQKLVGSGDKLIAAFMGPADFKKMRQMPTHYFDNRTYVTVCVSAKSTIDRQVVQVGAGDYRSKLNLHLNAGQTVDSVPSRLVDSGSVTMYVSDTLHISKDGFGKDLAPEVNARLETFHKKYWTLMLDIMILKHKKNALQVETWDALEGIRTDKQLLKVWPAIAEDFIKYAGIGGSGIVNLPVAQQTLDKISEQVKGYVSVAA